MSDKPIIIRKKNPFRKAEIPVMAVSFFYFFLFYAMAGGDLGLMASQLFSLNNGIIGLTIAVLGFDVTVLLSWFQVSRIKLFQGRVSALSRIGLRKHYELAELSKCRIKWYDGKDRRYPFFQFDFYSGKRLQIVGHHYRGLKPLILFLRDLPEGKLIEQK